MKSTKIQSTRQSTSDMNPGYSWLTRSDPSLRGVRTKFIVTHNPSYAQPGEEIYINLRNLGSTHPIDPNSINLRFVFYVQIQKPQRLIVSVGGETIYDNAGENLLRTYSDLWLSQRAREELTEFGVCNELLRNTTEKTDNKIAKTLTNLFRHQKIPIGKIISDQGIMVPSCMRENLSFTLVLADPSRVLSKGSYNLSSLEVEYDIVSSPSLRSLVMKQYEAGKSLPFRGLSRLHQTVWSKDSMLINENINLSKRCLNQVIMLFTKINRIGSEEFVFHGISNVNVTIKGIPGSVYNAGIRTVDLLTEARKTFSGHMNPHDFFCGDMFALCIDKNNLIMQNTNI